MLLKLSRIVYILSVQPDIGGKKVFKKKKKLEVNGKIRLWGPYLWNDQMIGLSRTFIHSFIHSQIQTSTFFIIHER